MGDERKVLLVPCSGIGKVHGLIGREAVYQVVDELGRDKADTLCLALLVTGDDEAVSAVRNHECITVDGCPKLCALKNVELAGGKVYRSARVVDAFKKHKGAQPGSATSLSEDGRKVTAEIAQDLADEVRQLLALSEEG